MKVIFDNYPDSKSDELHLIIEPTPDGGFRLREPKTSYTLLTFGKNGFLVYGGFNGTYAGAVPESAIASDGYIKVNR